MFRKDIEFPNFYRVTAFMHFSRKSAAIPTFYTSFLNYAPNSTANYVFRGKIDKRDIWFDFVSQNAVFKMCQNACWISQEILLIIENSRTSPNINKWWGGRNPH